MGKGGSPNFNEMMYQYTTNSPLHYKGKEPFKDGASDAYDIGTSYPIEDGESNVEAEKGELIFTKDLELYKINGKPHSKGGTPISANEGDFIFSQKLKAKGDKFNKIFGKFNPDKEYSFAEVASNFLKLNEFKDGMNSKHSFDKSTATMMHEEFVEKLGLLAFLQETSKGLPNGIPAVSVPVMEKLTQKPIEEGGNPTAANTFMEKGGGVFNFLGDYGDPTQKKLRKKNNDFDTNTEKRKGNQNWENFFYNPVIKEAQKRNKDLNDFSSHEAYQEYVRQDPELSQILLQEIQTNKMPLTNAIREALGKKGVENANNIYYYSDVPDWAKEDNNLFLDNWVDAIPGHRGVKYNSSDPGYRIPSRGKGTTGMETPSVRPGLTPQEGVGTKSLYRDLGYNTNEHVALLNSLSAMTSVPYFAPTRQQNYGLQTALGVASNVMPYNYQSLINEANRSGAQGFNANKSLSPTANIASARNALIAGQLAEQVSKIKGEEYNQNSNLYNNNQMQLANLSSQIGADKMQNADVYNSRVAQGRENLWANRKMATKEFIQEFANANNNRRMRNTVDYLMASRDPNYRFQNADLSAGFTAMGNPFSMLNSFTSPGSPNGPGAESILEEARVLKQRFQGNERLVDDFIRNKYNLRRGAIDPDTN